eukprot:TRINITY_DN8934_c0_g1_i1.p2 TRINITY_DN8934_c0_g1~~TRINITY_DN8934_c0_g1_i1.p2  ORF type:complete len:232 (-),score=53.70 TRINITY_DN8934_c0_g1_i1:626-1321(-)
MMARYLSRSTVSPQQMTSTVAKRVFTFVTFAVTSSPGWGTREGAMLWRTSTTGSGGPAAAEAAGVRVLRLRLPIVLARDCHVLAQLPPWPVPLLPLIAQHLHWPWVHVDDLCSFIVQSLAPDQDQRRGAVNVGVPATPTEDNEASPAGRDRPLEALDTPSQMDFMRELGRQRSQWALGLPVPRWAVRLLMGGEMAHMLEDTAAMDLSRMRSFRHEFKYPTLEHCISSCVQK